MGLKPNLSVANLNPGPGNYNIDRRLGKIGYYFGLKTPTQFSTIG